MPERLFTRLREVFTCTDDVDDPIVEVDDPTGGGVLDIGGATAGRD